MLIPSSSANLTFCQPARSMAAFKCWESIVDTPPVSIRSFPEVKNYGQNTTVFYLSPAALPKDKFVTPKFSVPPPGLTSENFGRHTATVVVFWGGARPFVRLVSVGAVLALGLGACGGSEDQSSEDAPVTTVADVAELLPRATTTEVPATVPPTTVTTAAPQVKAVTATTAARRVPVTSPPATDAPSVYYANCDAARAAGAAPLYRGDPGYRSGLDRDNDGVACE